MNDGDVLIQTLRPVMEEESQILAFREQISESCEWKDIGILTDEGNKNLVILLLLNNKPVSVFRFCLDIDQSITVIKSMLGVNGEIYLGYYQGNYLVKSEITNLESIANIWSKIEYQTSQIDFKSLRSFFTKIENDSIDTGRGDNISIETQRKIQLHGHGRCVFDGCGINLKVDELTGKEGNYGYLAHNVGSSENTTRSGKEISKLLSNDHKNILLMCDKHHRLIDKIAASDYSAIDISNMREKFTRISDKLLEGLKFEPIPVFAVLWPVGGNVASAPKDLEISQALLGMKYRANGSLNMVSDNPESLENMNENWNEIPKYIEIAASKIILQTKHDQHHAALFAFGMMGALIGLGAKIGNKCNMTPMLRFRDSGTWVWTSETPRDDVFKINYKDKIEKDDDELIITLSLTANPEPFNNFIVNSSMKHIEITATDGNMGNGCISNPEEGRDLLQQVHDLLHQIKSDFSIKTVHVLPCASNAACIFFGMAIDNYHPKIIVYDFNGPTMSPKLSIESNLNGVEIKAIS